jgi:hypothetical protein
MVFYWQRQLSFIPCAQRDKIALVTTVLGENRPGRNGPWWKSAMSQWSSVKIAHVTMVLVENCTCHNGPRWKSAMSQWSSVTKRRLFDALFEVNFFECEKVNCGINWSFPLSHKKRPPAFGRRVLFNSFSRHFVSRNFQFYLQNKDTQVLMYDEPKYMYIGRCKLM